MQEFGWSVGRNLRVDLRWGGDDADRWRRNAAELVALSPDVMLAAGGPVVSAMQRATRAVPIVFAQSIDPVGAGVVASLARPGGNVTGFTQFEYGLSGKWAELLKEIVPGLKRIGVLRYPATRPGSGNGRSFKPPPRRREWKLPPRVRDAGEIERDIAAFAREPNGGLIVQVSASAIRIVMRSSQAPLGIDWPRFTLSPLCCRRRPDLLRSRSADPIPARGRLRRSHSQREKPADLPVQAPTKYELAINLKTAKTLGLAVPPTLLARADEVIE